MGAASYIGRVGGLAVALGVGTAIATGHGVALAENPDSTSSDSSSSGSSGTTGTDKTTSIDAAPGTGTTTGTNTTSKTGTPAPSTKPSTATDTSGSEGATKTSSSTTSTTVADGVVVSAQTNSGSSTGTSSTETAGEIEPDRAEVAPTEVATPSSTPTTSQETDTAETDLEETDGHPEAPAPVGSSNVASHSRTQKSATPSSTTTAGAFARTMQSPADPADTIQQADTVAAFANPRTLASTGPINVSPMMAAAQTAQLTEVRPAPVTAAPQNSLAAVTNLVSSVIGWVMNPFVGATPSGPAAPPLMWALVAFARHEFEKFFAGFSAPTENVSPATQSTSLALAAAPLAAAAVAPPPPAFPAAGAQLSPSTQFVSWVTGNYGYPDDLMANTQNRFGITGTDVGVIWDNGMVDDLATPYNEHQVLMAFGDTFGIRSFPGEHWRPNILLRSADINLADGMTIQPGEWFTGNDFGGSPLTYVPPGAPYEYHARQIIFPEGLPAGITLIPTAGISVPTPGTEYGVTQYINFMSVTQWGAPGQWTTNYSAMAYSTDNGEVWKVAPETVRYNQPWSGNQNFQQAAYVRPGDGYVYTYGTPNGRQGAAYVGRVLEKDILDLTEYEYYSKGNPGGWFGWGATPAGWHKNNPAAATPIFGQDQGACGIAKPGNQVSEMSVQYNSYLNKYVVLHGDQFNNIVMRTADRPEGAWSTATVLIPQQTGGIYAPMMHPWSPSTMETGTDLYWNLSLWSDYNVMLLRTDLTKV